VRTFGNINGQAGESGESGERPGERKRRTKDEGVQQTSAGFHLQKGGLNDGGDVLAALAAPS